MRVSLIAGARPNFMKIAPLMAALSRRQIDTRLIHSGQHYDRKMSETFFEELEIPAPDINLGVGSGTHIWQITEVMRRLEEDFIEHRPDAVVVVGDVNSTVAAALTASKLQIPVSHVEAGLRSFDRGMPEELNRIVTDSVSDLLFTSEPSADENLRKEGVPDERIIRVGNVMIDTLRKHLEKARGSKPYEDFGLKSKGYVVLTLHRPSNVDHPECLESVLRAVQTIAEYHPVVFPMHPRTRARIEKFGFDTRDDLNGYLAVEPQGYHAMLGLMDAARVVLTDSGGIQEETTALSVPCLTLRENTERPVTVTEGSNRLVGWRTDDILQAFSEALERRPEDYQVPEFWDGHAAERIADHLA